MPDYEQLYRDQLKAEITKLQKVLDAMDSTDTSKRAPQKCSKCGSEEHNARNCKSETPAN